MRFSIITPCINGMPLLARCLASVRDQARGGLAVDHIVVDGGSNDGTAAHLAQVAGQCAASSSSSATLSWRSEPDGGMYDALNKGLSLAQGEILGWLNADEQYLPGALATVSEAFSQRPKVDILFGHALVVYPDGRLAAYRKCQPLRRAFVMASHFYNFSCAMFFRRRIWDEGLRLDPSYRSCGDAEWILRAMERSFEADCLDAYLSAFFLTGRNMSLSAEYMDERRRLPSCPAARFAPIRVALNMARYAERLIRGGCRQAFPLEYQLYNGSPGTRQTLVATGGRWRWPAGFGAQGH